MFEPLTFRGADIIHVRVIELREDLLLHLAHQRLGEAERGLVEVGMSALLRPAGVPGLGGDDRGGIHDVCIADADGSLGAIVALQCTDSPADIPGVGVPGNPWLCDQRANSRCRLIFGSMRVE